MEKGRSSKSWREKLEKDMKPKLVDVPVTWAKRIGLGKMLIPTPLLIDETIRKIPCGKLATVNTIREFLADKFHADITCPLTTGIFLNSAAQTAEEDKLKGETKISPWWRVLKAGGNLNPKFPGGIKNQDMLLKKEGFDIVSHPKNDLLSIKDFNNHLVHFN